jgi:2-haloacid dehalogenase
VKALAFDVFGTVVDWRGGIVREAAAFGAKHGIAADLVALRRRVARGLPDPPCRKVRSGELPWQRIDALHRLILDDMLDEFGLRGSRRARYRSSQSGVAPARSVAGCGRRTSRGSRPGM